MDLSDLHSPVANTSAQTDRTCGGIDPGFTVNYQLGVIPLRPIACLLNAVNAMTNLALQDFGGDVAPVVARLLGYPDVVIRSEAVSPGPGTTPVRYILWGVWSFTLFMLSHTMFQTMKLTLGFEGVVVGYLWVERPDSEGLSLAGSGDDGGAEGLQRRADVALAAVAPSEIPASSTVTFNGTGLSLINTTAPSNADDLRVFIKSVGHILTDREFFLPILAGLDYVAHFQSTSAVQQFKLHSLGEVTLIEFENFDSPPRREPPFFEYRGVANALRALPEQMAPLGRWSEALIVIQLDGVRVGDGWLRKVEP